MKISLVICTFKRPDDVFSLLESVIKQTLVPAEILIIDGSDNLETKFKISNLPIKNLKYFLVEPNERGLTKQRNFGVSKVSFDIDYIIFLDDDLILEFDFIEQITSTFLSFPNAIGVGGIDLYENSYFKGNPGKFYSKFSYYEVDDWFIKEPTRYKLRKIFGLMSDFAPFRIPFPSHGRTLLPPNGKTYNVDHFMGGISCYRKELFDNLKFSIFFEGYGLYEDFDFCVRSSFYGKLYVNTNARVWHYHKPSGRPNKFRYGKMVVWNGYYVWRLKHPNPGFKNILKWHLITIILAFLRLLNSFTGPDRKGSFLEAFGRFYTFINLFFVKPKIKES